jgi:hypothetical protein
MIVAQIVKPVVAPIVCENPEVCARKKSSMQQRMEQNIKRIQEEYEELISNAWIETSTHTEKRLEERDISYNAVKEVLECYSPMEWTDTRNYHYHQHKLTSEEKLMLRFHPYKILICGESELYPERTPLAIACGYGDKPAPGRKWGLKIITAYHIDPSQWSKDLSQRLCFCC